MSSKTCKDCRYFVQNDYIGCCTLCCDVTCDDDSACIHFAELTVFDKITESPEVLAENLVYRYDGNGTWRSFLLYGYEFLTKEEAISATEKRLKEVENEQ